MITFTDAGKKKKKHLKNSIAIHNKKLDQLGIEGNFLNLINAIYPNPSDIRLSSEKLIDFFLILRTGNHSPIYISVEYYIGSPRL